jgi:EmrB/QacA subfamily drug resistance transporter
LNDEMPVTEVNVSTAEKRTILTALAVVMLLSALDQTIVTTAMPRIIEQLHGLAMYAWVTTSYMLASTVSVPIYGKLSDLYGRKPILIFGIVVFLIGSFLCGLAGEFGDLPLLGDGMMQLVIFRGVQGLGGGALMTVSFAVIADLYPPRERGRLFGLFGAVFGIATVIGPFIGGFFTDHGTATWFNHEVAGWRWVFYVNLPLGLVALFMILYRLPPLRHSGSGKVDYVGAALVILTFTPLLLALTLGGTSYAWDSPNIVGLFVIALVAFAIFLYVEMRTVEPILSLQLFKIKTFRTAIAASFVVSMAFLGVVMFMPLYMQVVQGNTATESGLALLPLMAGHIFSTVLSGRLVTRTGRYKPFMIAGGVVLIIGVMTLTQINADTTTADLAWRLVLTGLGLGPAQTLFNIVIQNSAPANELGSATGMSQFTRQIGSTVGLAIFGTLLTHSLLAELPRRLPVLPGATHHEIDLSVAQRQAMNHQVARSQVDAALEKRLEVLERAYRGDDEAVTDVMADSRLPDAVKELLRDGGLRARIHDQLEARADSVEMELRVGEEGRDRLLQDPLLAASVKEQLANIPSRALHDPEVVGTVVRLFRGSIMAKEDAMVDSAIVETLLMVRKEVGRYGQQLMSEIERGTKEAFATSIADMLTAVLWIIVAGVILIVFIPEIPMRSVQTKGPVTAEG